MEGGRLGAADRTSDRRPKGRIAAKTIALDPTGTIYDQILWVSA